MVTIKADLLHFQPAPSASESCIGGVDLIGAKVAAQANVRNANMSKGRFIAVLLFPVCADLATLFPDPFLYARILLSGIGFSLSSRAQTRARPVVGILSATASDAPRNLIEAILRGLDKMGYADGDTVSIEYRWADGDYSKLSQLASELVSRGVSILVANGSADAAKAAKAATSAIPIVFAIGGDPIKLGLVQSINRPSGNITGVSFFFSALNAKRLEIMREMIPSLTRVGFLVNPENSVTETDISNLEEAAHTLMMQVKVAKGHQHPAWPRIQRPRNCTKDRR